MAKHWWQSLGLALGAILLGMAIAGCGPAPTTEETSQVVQGILGDLKTFNSALSTESPNISGLTSEGLVRKNPFTDATEPALAESWETSEGGLRIVFTLREGLRWSDGAPLTTKDVDFTFNEIYLNEAIPTSARDILRVGQSRSLPEVRALDDRRVEFRLPEPFAPFFSSAGLGIFPAHILQESVRTLDDEGKPEFLSKWSVSTPPEEIIVNGPYQVESYATSQRIIFRRNPYYWQDPKPFIERVFWQIVENQDVELVRFRSKDLDSMSVSPEYFSLLKREEDRSNFTIYNGGPAYGTRFITFNLNKGSREDKPLVDPVRSRWFNTLEFRQAIAHAIDRDKTIDNVYRGLGEPQNSHISVQSPFYDPTVKSYDYDLNRARELLRSAGFSYDEEDRLIDRDGNRVRFTLLTNAGNKVREAIGAQIKQDLDAIGIQVDFNPVAFSVLVDKLTNTLEWECILIGFTGGNEPNSGANLWNPDGNLHMFNQKPRAGEPLVGREVADWEARISELYVQGASELDLEKRKAIYAETQQLSQEYLPMINLVNSLAFTAVRDRFEGIRYSPLGGAFWNLEDIKIAAED